ncbi:MAG: aminotransferase class I/II-fold pyridoxal phosphate-dependent enzyme [Acidimicrobiales bacterium]
MVPGPVQAAAAVALDDDDHVMAQRRRYRGRLERLAAGLRGAGLDAAVPDGTFYLWVPAPDWARVQGEAEGRDGSWVLAEALADAAGVLVSPGEFYGAAGHVRIAVVQPDERIDLALDRLAATDARLTAAPASTT